MNKLSIIIVNYRSASYILQAIGSAMQFESGAAFEWIVVDNDSRDDSQQFILAVFPFVQWININYNAGFARANNAGIRAATGDTILLLNPDTIVVDDAIDRCFSRFMHSSCVACSVQLLNTDRSLQISGNYFMKGGINHLLPLPYYGKWLKGVARLFSAKTPHVDIPGEEEIVDWINGAFLMVKKSAIAVAGLMDEDFFLFAEETEWCSRLRLAGPLCIYGEIRMIHLQGEVTNENTGAAYKGYNNLYDKKGLQLLVSNHLRIRKQYGVGWFLFQLLNVTLAVPVFFLASFFDRLFHGSNPLGDWKLVKALAKNTLQLWRLAPMIMRNRPHFYKMM